MEQALQSILKTVQAIDASLGTPSDSTVQADLAALNAAVLVLDGILDAVLVDLGG